MCIRDRVHDRFNYDRILAEQHGAVDGDTAALGGGYFLTVAGEAYYRYQCRRRIVTARPTKDCYAALPIDLEPNDALQFVHLKDIEVNETEFFLEPTSRVITTRGIKIPCSSTFAPLYAGINGPWIRAEEFLTTAEVPESLDHSDFSALPINDESELSFDFEEGGIYTKEDLSLIHI